MIMKNKQKFVTRLATCSAVVGGLAVGMPANAEAAFNYTSLGTGAELRAQAMPATLPIEMKGEEGKCGEGKCGEGKCGEGDDKGGEGKCGEGKCGS